MRKQRFDQISIDTDLPLLIAGAEIVISVFKGQGDTGITVTV